jgi:hypothetical protein
MAGRNGWRLLQSGLVVLAMAAPASAQELITNGNFETGTLAGWTASAVPGSAGAFVVGVPGAATPTSLHPSPANPSGGGFYAVSDQSDPTVAALSQTFTVPPGGGTVTLSFQMFVNNWNPGPAIIDPGGLILGVAGVPPNQHARVDLLTAAASPFDTGAGVIRSFYLGADPNNPFTTLNPYTAYSFDLTPNVGGGAGGTFQIRFAEADNLSFLNQGVDNVSIVFAVAVPTMNTWLFVALGCLVVLVSVMVLSTRGRMQVA